MTLTDYEKDPNHIITDFIKYYYNKLASDPSKLYQMYAEDAVLKHQSPHLETTEIASEDFNGISRIEKYWKTLTVLSQSKIMILTVNTIKNSDDTLVSTIVGELLLKEDYDTDEEETILPTRTFTQIFILSPHEKRDSYYIKSDILVFIPVVDYMNVETEKMIEEVETNGVLTDEQKSIDTLTTKSQQEVVEVTNSTSPELNDKKSEVTKNESPKLPAQNNSPEIVEIGDKSNKHELTASKPVNGKLTTSVKKTTPPTLTNKASSLKSETSKSSDAKKAPPSPVISTATPSTSSVPSTPLNTSGASFSATPIPSTNESSNSQKTPVSLSTTNTTTAETTQKTPPANPSKPLTWASNLKGTHSAPNSSSTGKSVSSYTKTTIITQPATAPSQTAQGNENRNYEVSITCKSAPLQADEIKAALKKEGIAFTSVYVTAQKYAVVQFENEEMQQKALVKKTLKDDFMNELVIEKREKERKNIRKKPHKSSNNYAHYNSSDKRYS